jgi:hypothetical protein
VHRLPYALYHDGPGLDPLLGMALARGRPGSVPPAH